MCCSMVRCREIHACPLPWLLAARLLAVVEGASKRWVRGEGCRAQQERCPPSLPHSAASPRRPRKPHQVVEHVVGVGHLLDVARVVGQDALQSNHIVIHGQGSSGRVPKRTIRAGVAGGVGACCLLVRIHATKGGYMPSKGVGWVQTRRHDQGRRGWRREGKEPERHMHAARCLRMVWYERG